jgi:2,4-dienoyl-CoA reductase-like NADH-dependent reductase (Old Yellow Enzyme family)
MSLLFSPLTLRSVSFANRIFVSPMCQYSSDDGMPNEWHFVHLGSRAVGGAALVMVEASAVSPEGRISASDMGIWSGAHAEAFVPITRFIHSQGAAAGIQLAHAGRKGSTQVPWLGRRAVAIADGGWQPQAPTALPFNAEYPLPREMTEHDIAAVVADFAAAAARCVSAGFDALEIHAGHGYLLHEFLSPLSNQRSDRFGGALERRAALLLAVVRAVRSTWPDRLPLFVRLSVTDWLDGGWSVEESIALARWLRDEGVDLIDCSSGSIVPGSQGPMAPGFQVPLAEAVRQRAGVATAAVGLITEPQQAEAALQRGACDIVFLARQLLRDPYWPLRAAEALEGQASWPVQYLRAVNPSARS